MCFVYGAEKLAMQHLGRLETLGYFSVYIVYLCYGLWSLLAVHDQILRISQYEFSSGWWFLQSPRDDTGDELENFGQYISTMWPFYLLHLTVCSVLHTCWTLRRQSISCFIVSIIALVCSMHLVSVLLMLLLMVSYYTVAHLFASKTLTWLLSGFWVLVINWLKSNLYWQEALGYAEFFTVLVMLSWSLLRGCSYSLNRLSDVSQECTDVHEVYAVEHYVGYMLYFPTLVYGPLLSYKRYIAFTKTPPKRFTDRIQTLAWELARALLWWLCLELALHYLYIHYMARDIAAIQLVRQTFSHHAIGYFMGQFFFMYYVITYGLGIAFARFDGLEPPRRPRCIGRIHFYSDMWKHFDEGLYEFLFQHIYTALCTAQSSVARKLFATMATFGFVYLWHGCYSYVLLWSAMNFGCLVVEKCYRSLINSPLYGSSMSKYLSAGGMQRFNALLATQIFIPAAFSNVYFIAGQEVGNALMYSAYCSGIINYVALTFCSYCFFQCSELISIQKESNINSMNKKSK